MEESFLRQRRNLMIVNIIVFLVCFASIEIGETVTFSGIIFKITNPSMIYFGLLCMYIYFFLRYIQIFFSIKEDITIDFGIPRWNKNYQEPILYGNKYYVCYKIIWNSIRFLIELLFMISFMIFNILFFDKKFSEYFFPLLFSIIIGILSFNSDFFKIKKDEFDKVYMESINYEIKQKFDNLKLKILD